MTMQFAVDAAIELGYTSQDKLAPVYADFAHKAAGLELPFATTVPARPDLQGGYHPEYQGYPWKSFFNSPIPIFQPLVKQADAVMLSYPLGVDLDPQVLAN